MESRVLYCKGQNFGQFKPKKNMVPIILAKEIGDEEPYYNTEI